MLFFVNIMGLNSNSSSDWTIKLEAQVSLYRSPDINKPS
jgi:hypothetical protein